VDRRPSETSPVPSSTFTTSRSPYAGGFLAAASSGSSPLPWPSLSLSSSAPSFSPCGANISTLQDSLDVTGCCFAPLSQGDTTLQHIWSPRRTGCLLRGLLTVTTTGLAPVSRRCLSGHTSDLLCAIVLSQFLGAVASASCLRRFSSVLLHRGTSILAPRQSHDNGQHARFIL